MHIYIRRPLQSVERVRLQPSINLLSSSQISRSNDSIHQQLSKAQQLKAAKNQAAKPQPKQPWGTHASSSQGRMLQI